MYRFILTLLFIQLVTLTEAQNKWSNINIKKGDIHKTGNFPTEILAHNKEGYIAVAYSKSMIGTHHTVTQYNQSLKPIKSNKIKLKHKKEKLQTLGVKNIKGQLFVFGESVYKRFLNIYAQKININTFKPEGKLINIASIKLPTIILPSGSTPECQYNAKDLSYQSAPCPIIDINYSNDSSKILISHNIRTKNNDNRKMHFYVYDTSFNKLWDKEISIEYKKKLSSRTSQIVSM